VTGPDGPGVGDGTSEDGAADVLGGDGTGNGAGEGDTTDGRVVVVVGRPVVVDPVGLELVVVGGPVAGVAGNGRTTDGVAVVVTGADEAVPPAERLGLLSMGLSRIGISRAKSCVCGRRLVVHWKPLQ
jgi:hypothetical protein